MIIRRKINRHFTIVPNEPIVDEQLSFEASGRRGVPEPMIRPPM